MSNVPLRTSILCAGIHPLILDDSRLRSVDTYAIDRVGADEETLLPAIERYRPDVLLIDLLQTSSLKTLERVTNICPSCRIVVLTSLRKSDVTGSLFSAGAVGVLYRFTAAIELPGAITAVFAGQRYLSPAFTTASAPADKKGAPPAHHLSPSDEQILRLVAKDYTADRIARALGLSIGTIRLSIAYLKRQFGRRTNRELRLYAVTHGLISDC